MVVDTGSGSGSPNAKDPSDATPAAYIENGKCEQPVAMILDQRFRLAHVNERPKMHRRNCVGPSALCVRVGDSRTALKHCGHLNASTPDDGTTHNAATTILYCIDQFPTYK